MDKQPGNQTIFVIRNSRRYANNRPADHFETASRIQVLAANGIVEPDLMHLSNAQIRDSISNSLFDNSTSNWDGCGPSFNWPSNMRPVRGIRLSSATGTRHDWLGWWPSEGLIVLLRSKRDQIESCVVQIQFECRHFGPCSRHSEVIRVQATNQIPFNLNLAQKTAIQLNWTQRPQQNNQMIYSIGVRRWLNSLPPAKWLTISPTITEPVLLR